jgi:hypothetical protein
MTASAHAKPLQRPARHAMRALLAAALLLALLGGVVAQSRVLTIAPIAQQTPVWCWAAVAEMLLRHLGYPGINPAGNYQCGIVGSLGGECWYNCGLPRCITGIGTLSAFAGVLERYPDVASHVHGRQLPALLLEAAGTLDPEEIMQEIDARRPIAAGISPGGLGAYLPPGISEHVVLIVGYRHLGDRFALVVNDPMPMPNMPFNPYIRAGGQLVAPGRYEIDYDAFVRRLGYKDSLFGFKRD